MKSIIIILVVLIVAAVILFKTPSTRRHRVNTFTFIASSLKGNSAGENPYREVNVYLPPDYHTSEKHYPVLYYLHGFGGSHKDYEFLDIDHIMDSSIAKGEILPFIVVVPNSNNLFNGGYYYNSDINGKWSDYIAKDLVDYIDGHFRTIKRKESRAIAGHSMGGQGALRIAMLYPEIFNSVYALSPSILYWGDDFKPEHEAFKAALLAEDMEVFRKNSYAMAFAGMGRVFTPDNLVKPFGMLLPVKKEGQQIVINEPIYTIWDRIFLYNLVVEQQNNLRKIEHIFIEWGTKDEYKHIPSSCQLFCKRLDSLEIQYQKDNFIGGHIDQLVGKEGRFAKNLLPFISKSLKQ